LAQKRPKSKIQIENHIFISVALLIAKSCQNNNSTKIYWSRACERPKSKIQIENYKTKSIALLIGTSYTNNKSTKINWNANIGESKIEYSNKKSQNYRHRRNTIHKIVSERILDRQKLAEYFDGRLKFRNSCKKMRKMWILQAALQIVVKTTNERQSAELVAYLGEANIENSNFKNHKILDTGLLIAK